MITHLKDRIIALKESTTNSDVVLMTSIAANSCKSSEYLNTMIAESLITDLANIDDTAAKKFVIREQRMLAITNLGLKELIRKIAESELMFNQQTKYAINAYMQHLERTPEYALVEGMLEQLSSLSWHKDVSEGISKIRENVEKYKEDIYLCNFINEFKQSTGDYLVKFFEAEYDNYFINRDETAKKTLLEKIAPYLYDNKMKGLNDFLRENAAGLQAYSDNVAEIKEIHSPVIMNESDEVFYASGRFMKKTGNKVIGLTEAEITALPKSFIMLAEFVNRPNVKVSSNAVTVYTTDKKVEVLKENEVTVIKLNDKTMPIQHFTKFFMNEGIFRNTDNDILANCLNLFEHFDSIYEIDYGKRIISKVNEGNWIDVFKIGNNVSAIRIDNHNRINEFYSPLNAMQTKVLVQEHVGFDISKSLRDLLPDEEAKINQYKQEIANIDEAVATLTEKKNAIITEVNESALLKNDERVSELLKAIDGEVEKLKESKMTFGNIIDQLQTVSIGFTDKDFVAEAAWDDKDISRFWKDSKNADKVMYFAQRDGGEDNDPSAFLVGKQTLSDYNDNQFWEPLDYFTGKKAGKDAIQFAKSEAKKDPNGIYVETDDSEFVEHGGTFESVGVNEANVTVDVDWCDMDDDETQEVQAELKKYGIKIKQDHKKEQAWLTGPKDKLRKYLEEIHYAGDVEEVEELHPELYEGKVVEAKDFTTKEEYMAYLKKNLKGKSNLQKEKFMDKLGHLNAKFDLTADDYRSFNEGKVVEAKMEKIQLNKYSKEQQNFIRQHLSLDKNIKDIYVVTQKPKDLGDELEGKRVIDKLELTPFKGVNSNIVRANKEGDIETHAWYLMDADAIIEGKDPDGNDKFEKSNIKKESEDTKPAADNEIGVGDKIRMKNGKLGVVTSVDETDGKIIANMEDGKNVEVPKQHLKELEIIEKKSKENKPEVKTTDGAQSVHVKEAADEWVDGTTDVLGKRNAPIKVHALEYTTNGENDMITITYKGKETKLPKKDINVKL